MPTLLACTGFEFGTTAGWGTGVAGNKIFDAIVGTPAIVTTSPRTGTYCLELSAVAATEGIRWGTDTLGTSKTHVVGVVYVYFPTLLPVTNPDLIQFQCVGPNYILRFRASDSKLCVGIPGGAEVAGPVVAANTWYRLDFHMDVSANPNTIDWKVDGTAQTQFSNAVAADTLFSLDLGWTLAGFTATVRFDDWCVSTTAADYPLGATTVRILTPDTGGSLDVATINTAEWNTFAGATPTLSAWNATTALGAIDEIPVGLGASADGFARITGTDADYVGVPMTSYTLAGGEAVAGLRMLACCWAASGTTCTHSFASYNGTTATVLLAAADVSTDNSSSAPAWVAKMCTLADINTQGELDALQFRFGCTDSTPDAGIHAIYGELAVTEATATDATVTPAAIAVTIALPRPPVNVASAPALLSATVVSPDLDVSVTTLPAVTATTITLPDLDVSVAALPAVTLSTVALPQATAAEMTTVTPATITAVASLADIDVHVGAVPALATGTVNLSQAAVNAAAAPAVMATVVALGDLDVSVAAAPAVIANVLALPQVSVSVAAIPAVLAAVVTLADLDVSVAAVPAVFACVVSAPQALVLIPGAATALPAAVTVVLAFPHADVGVGVAPALLAASVAVPAVAVGILLTPTVIEVLVAFYAATVPFTVVMGPGSLHGPLPRIPGASTVIVIGLDGAGQSDQSVGAVTSPAVYAIAGGVT